MTVTKTIAIRVTYEFDQRASNPEPDMTAAGLLLNPNYHTIEDGVQLIDHEIKGITD